MYEDMDNVNIPDAAADTGAEPASAKEGSIGADVSAVTAFEAPETPAAKKKRRSLFPGICLGIVLVIAVEAAALFLISKNIDYPAVFTKMSVIDRLIDKYYLYEADGSVMAEWIFTGMMYGLTDDSYSAYYSASSYEEEEKTEKGSYVGIGIGVVTDEETLGMLVSSVTAGGPAERAGIEVGDIIIMADGTDLRGLDLSTAVSHVTGEEGSLVELVLLRGEEELTLTVTRESIVTQTVFTRVIKAGELEKPKLGSLKVGYIGISGFKQVTLNDFVEAVENLQGDEEVDGLIMDLRNNGGGDMNVCLDMLNLLIAEDDELVYHTDADDDYDAAEIADGEWPLLLSIEDRAGGKTVYCGAGKSRLEVPLVVLVNARSASASEIFAGVLRDYGYTIIGSRTYGKGIVQSTIKLYDGSAVKFTTEQYRLPGGDYVHGVGITPTIELDFEPYDDVKENQVNFASGEEQPDLTKDNQIMKAVSLIEDIAYELYQETA